MSENIQDPKIHVATDRLKVFKGKLYQGRVKKMAQQVKVLAAKSEDLSLIP